jgi:hypothetical protein
LKEIVFNCTIRTFLSTILAKIGSRELNFWEFGVLGFASFQSSIDDIMCTPEIGKYVFGFVDLKRWDKDLLKKTNMILDRNRFCSHFDEVVAAMFTSEKRGDPSLDC